MKAFIDGSSNGIYGYLLRKKKRIIRDYPLTNNQAEWLAFLTLLVDLEPNSKIHVYSDSQIVVNQYYGDWETKNPNLKHLKEVCLELIKIKNLEVHLEWVRREENPFGKVLERIVRKERKAKRKLREKIERGYE